MKKNPNFVATTNACKLCRPLGAAIAFRGIEGCVPFLHGSQGCATYMRRYIISHFNEPIDIASSSLGEKNAVYGGGPNLKLGLKNVTSKYHPQLIGIATTCLTETIGDDVPMLLAEYESETTSPEKPMFVHVATPSYAGSHMEGFHGAVRAVIEQLAQRSQSSDTVNLLGGFASAADLRYLREICGAFALTATILPDYGDTLDGPALDDYPLIPQGGTPLAAIRAMGGAKATMELGSTLPEKSGGTVLRDTHGVALHRIGLPIGIRASDTFVALLTELSGRSVPVQIEAARGRLVDSLIDGHKYLFGVKAVVYGEEDLVVGLTSFLAEIGIVPVLCASGGKSGQLAEAISGALADLPCPLPEVREDVDFHDIESLAEELGCQLVVGHSKGYALARRLAIPLIRVGFPIHDRLGGQRILHLGYEGAQRLFDTIVNTLIERRQDGSPVGYSYM
jgi:nitrogenase molybdenum-iron protein NifN